MDFFRDKEKERKHDKADLVEQVISLEKIYFITLYGVMFLITNVKTKREKINFFIDAEKN